MNGIGSIAVVLVALITFPVLAANEPRQNAGEATTQPGLLLINEPATQPVTLKLWPQGVPLAKGEAEEDTPTIAVYLPPMDKANGCGVVICPGGGYQHLSIVKEGSDVAHWLNENGVAAFVLKYRIKPYQQPVPMLDGQRAIRLVRSRAKEWGVDPNRLGMMGFSAGGHVASTVGTHFDAGNAESADLVDRVSCRPDFLVLVYPVISMKEGIAHEGSRSTLLGKDPSNELVESLSNETQVTEKTPPTFIAHSRTDGTVKVVNSELFHEALQKHGVASELLVLPKGAHGWGLSMKDPVIGAWKERCLGFLGKQGFMAQGKG